jgi:TP901 family phage tail tape measure protein
MAAITLDIGANTRQAEKDIQKLVSRSYNINLNTKGDQPLGRITGKVNEFSKSLDASNARVIAFGASAGIIFGLERAFTALVSSTIEVQKSLQDINVILNVSAQNLQKFGAELFSIARNTGQSFQEVAKAATEFSRQGLGVEETLKRTNEALILSRLSGLDTAKSVEALTAAVNSFASQAVTATEIVNKFANVDAAFAVSSADLADAIARVGSSAAQSGVSLNELIAIVTSAQQTTARGGAVIGNSFKTIFTRLQREKVVDLLESLGISGTDSSGQVKSTIQLLTDLGKVYDTLGSQQQAFVAEQVGGVFQINILKAALADLGKEYSIYGSALNVAAGATDQAIRRNEELNKTYASQINALQENARQLAAAGGERLLGPSIDRLVGGTNTLLSGFNESDGQNVGTVLGKGILDGIGQFIAGPGLALIGGVLLKLFRDLAKFATGSVQQLLGLNTAATQQRDLQTSIQQILSKNPKLIELALKGEQGLNAAANSLLASLQKQTVELQKQAQVAQQISKAFISQAGVRMIGGVPIVPAAKTSKPGKAGGYIPNFSAEVFNARELGASRNVRETKNIGTIGGKPFQPNNEEIQIPNMFGTGDTGVIPKYGNGIKEAAKMIARGESGSVLDKSDRNRAKGFIPNFAGTSALYPLATGSKIQDYKILLQEGANYKGPMNKPFGALSVQEANQALARSRANKGQISNKQKSGITDLGKTNKISLIYGQKAGVKSVTGSFTDSNKNRYSASFASSGYNAKVEPDESNLEDLLGKQVIDFVNRFSSIFGGNSGAAKIGSIDKLANAGAFRSIAGTIFETAVTQATGSAIAQASRSGGQSAAIDYVSPNPKLRKLFNNIPGSYEAKIGDNPELVNSVADKAYRSGFFKKQGVFPGAKIKNMASGFIPNFNSTNRGVPVSQIRAHFDKNGNPIAVTNTRDEPNGLKDAIGRERKGIGMYSRGFIPNFAIEDPDVQGVSAETGAAAIIAQLSGIAFAFAFTGDQYKTSLEELIQKNKEARNVTGKWTEAQKAATIDLVNAGKITQEEADKRKDAAKFGGTRGQKTGAFLKSNAFGISAAAPILGETIKNIVGQETPGARKTGAVASAAGQIGSFAATGALIAPGPIGAGVGAAVGALLTIPNLVNELTSSLPELAMAAKKASQDLTKFGDVGQRLLVASSDLSRLLTEGGSQESISKAQDIYAKALSELSDVDRERLSSAARVGKLEEEYAKVLQEKVEETRSTERFVKLQEAEETKDFGVFAGGFDTNPETRQGRANAELLGNTFKDFFTTSTALPQNLKDQVKAGKITEQEAIQQNFQQQKEVGLPALGNLLQKTLKTGSSVFGVSKSSQKELENILQNTLPESKTKAEDINQLLNLADDGGEAFLNVLTALIQALDEGPEALKKALEASKLDAEANKARTEALKKSSESINAHISTMQKNIAVQNLLAQTLDVTAESFRTIAADINIARQFTQPAAALEQVIGADKTPSRTLRSQSDIALIEEDLRSGISSAGIDLKDNIRGIFQKPFQEQRDKLTGELSKTNITGTPKDIETETAKIIDKYKPLFEENDQANQNLEKYLSEFVTGQKSQEQLLDALRNEMSNLGIDTTQASNEVELAIEAFNAKSIQEQVKAFQQRAKLASETKQAILQDKINQALGTFGGFEGFMNRPNEEENYIQRITPDLEKIGEIRSSLPLLIIIKNL